QSGQWQATSDGRYIATSSGTASPAIDLIAVRAAPAYLLDITAKFNTSSQGGIIFDQYSPTEFKFVTLSADAKQVIIGHRAKAGWFTDALYNNSTIASGVDYTLDLTLKGNSVSVTFNGQ